MSTTTSGVLSLHKFYFDAITYMRDHYRNTGTTLRYGQGMFNYLNLVRPDLSERIRGGSGVDPFFCASPNDPQFDRFIAFIEANWYETKAL